MSSNRRQKKAPTKMSEKHCKKWKRWRPIGNWHLSTHGHTSSRCEYAKSVHCTAANSVTGRENERMKEQKMWRPFWSCQQLIQIKPNKQTKQNRTELYSTHHDLCRLCLPVCLFVWCDVHQKQQMDDESKWEEVKMLPKKNETMKSRVEKCICWC